MVDDVPVTNSPPPMNTLTASDEEIALAAISDANLPNSSVQSNDVDVDPELDTSKRSAEVSNSEFTTVSFKKKR